MINHVWEIWRTDVHMFARRQQLVDQEVIGKFAELVVRRCMDVVKDINQEYDGGSTTVNAADEIAEYFGIKE